MRILHVLDHSLPLHSGYTFRTISLLRALRDRGYETYHLTSPKQGPANGVREEEVDGWHFFRTPITGHVLQDVPALGELELMGELSARLEGLVRRLRPHVIHAHSPVLNAIPALRVGKRLGVPVVYEVRAFWEDAAVDHGTTVEGSLRYKMSRALETYAVKRADHVVTICDGLRKDLVARHVAAEHITVVPNGVDVEKFNQVESTEAGLRTELGVAGAFVLGFVGSFYAYEGLRLLLTAMPQILAARPDVRIVLVGGGPQEDALKSQAQDTGIADKVIFTGRVPHGVVDRYYDAIDVLVYPRLSMRLTELVTPLKPLEAMAQGRLVIASDVGGHRELMRDGETATIFKAGDAVDLAQKVLALAANPERWAAIRAAARAYVLSQRSWSDCTAPYDAVYAGLASKGLKTA